jgi:RNA polymerase sigma-70 factor (ECF subfamily)
MATSESIGRGAQSTVAIADVIVQVLNQEFEELVRGHYQMAYHTAYAVLGRAEDAEDVAQTVFLRLLHQGTSGEAKRNPRAYIYRAAVNEALNLIRSRKKQILTDEADQFAAEPPPSDSAEETHDRLYAAIAKLSPGAAHILILRYVHKYSDAEIAKLLGTSRGTIAVSLYRSRARLKKLMRVIGDQS